MFVTTLADGLKFLMSGLCENTSPGPDKKVGDSVAGLKGVNASETI